MTAVGLLFLIPATVASLYYAALTGVGWQRSRTRLPDKPQTRFAILIPAHDEAASLPRTLVTVLAVDYPADRVRVMVIADNCTDDTADLARRAGVECLERTDPFNRGKGYALAFGIPHALATEAEAVLVLDADCRLDPLALRCLDAAIVEGVEVAQSAVRSVNTDAGPAGLVAAVGSEIENAVQSGLTRLGRSVWLRGTGMAFRRSVVERLPWASFGLAEDAEYASRLRSASVRVRFVPEAVIRCEAPPRTEELCRQRRRWRASLFVGGKSWLDRAATSKPLVLAQLATTLLVVTCTGEAWLIGWSIALALLTVGVYARALQRVEGSVQHLWRVPAVVAKLAWVTLGGFLRRGGAWERMSRATS